VRIVVAVCDMGVANNSCNGSCSVGRLRVKPSVGEERSLCGRGVGKGVYRVAVAKGFELRIATTLSERGVRKSNNNNSVGALRVHAGVDERHLLQDEREVIRGGNDKALLRAEVMGSMRRNLWRVDKASFRRNFDRGRKKKKLLKRQR
jgi:hypothetical protein